MWNLGSKKSVYSWEIDVDRIFEDAARQLDSRKRRHLYDRWQEIFCENQPMIFTATSAVLYAAKDKFGNLKPTVYGGLFHNIEEIYIKKIALCPYCESFMKKRGHHDSFLRITSEKFSKDV